MQILIPLAAHLAPEALRGRTVGTIMGGLLSGILLSRPLSSLLARGFRLACGVLYRRRDDAGDGGHHRSDDSSPHAPSIAAPMAACWVSPVASVHALRGAAPALAVPGTAVRRVQLCSGPPRPLELVNHYGLAQSRDWRLLHWLARWALWRHRIAAGWQILAIRASPRTGISIAAVISFPPGLVGGADGVYWLALTGVVLDFAVQMNMVLGQRAIYALDATSRDA